MIASRQLAVLGLTAAMALTAIAPARAEDGPYPQVAAVEGACPANYVYSSDVFLCVSQIGVYDGQTWICRGHKHPQFQLFPWEKRPQRCCRKNWPPEDPNDGRGKGLCHRWHPKPYHMPGGEG